MNYLAIILAVAWIFLIVRGVHHGILRMMFGALSIVLVLVIAAKANPIVVSYLDKRPEVVAWADKTAEKYVDVKEKESGERVSKDIDSSKDNSKNIDNIEIPSFMRKSMLKELEKIKDSTSNIEEEATEKIKNATVEIISGLIIKGIAMIIVLIGAMIIIAILRIIINLVGKLPIIHGASKIFGGVLGALEGLAIIWIVLFMIECFSATSQGTVLMSEVENSRYLVTLSECNPLHDIF